MLDRLCLFRAMAALFPPLSLTRRMAACREEAILHITERASSELPARAVRRLTLLAAAALTLTPAAAQRPPAAEVGTYARAIAAGYKASMYCSGIFTAGRAPAQIDADELSGIYPEYDAIVPTLTAVIDRDTREVRVPWSTTMAARVARWNPFTGCTTLPIGGGGGFVRWSGSEPQSQRGPRPGRWPVGDAGVAPRPSPSIAGRVAAAFDGRSYGAGKTVGVVILRDGKIVAERDAPGWTPFTANRTWSVAKSIAGTLIGRARFEGARFDDGFNHAAMVEGVRPPQWSTPGDPRGAITLDSLLRMASGLHSDSAGNRTDAIYFGGTAVNEQALGWPLEAPPGTRFRYANNDILIAVLAMRYALGEERYRDYPRGLFERLGMAHTVAERDWRGNYILSSQVWSTARDLARLGQFWLQDGVWQGRRLLPEGWMRYMTTPSGPQPASGPGYGATLWLFGPQQGLPAGSFAAQGNRGQYVMVVPSARLVVVRRGEDPGAARFDIARFTADILAATR